MNDIQEQVVLRPAKPGDQSFLLRLFSGGRPDLEWADLCREDKDALIRKQYLFQQKQLLKHYPLAEYNIVLLGEQPVGRLYTYKGEKVYRILDIMLLPRYRNMGIGTKLLKSVLRESAAAGKTVRLQVPWFNNSAGRLYESLGFCTVEDKGFCREMQWPDGG